MTGALPLAQFGRGILRRSEFLVVVSIVIFAAGAGIAGAYIGFDDVLDRAGRLSVIVVAILLLLSLANYTFRMLRWHLYERHLGIKVPMRLTALYYLTGLSMTTTPGKIGETLRLWLLARRHGYRYDRTAPLLLGDRIGDANAVLLLSFIGLAAFAEYAWATALAAAALAVATAAVLWPRWLLGLVLALYGVIGRSPRLFAGARRVLRHTGRLFSPGLYAATLALGVVGWLAECFALYILLIELGADVTMQQAIFVFTFSMLVGAVSMLPGGLGSTEATMFALLTIAGVEADTALAATAIIRATTLWFAVLLGFLLLPFSLRLARKPAPHERAASAAEI
ncbi:MAG: lysylphosphatidylglycerol synthase transmembrane domain-containing protein [Alphaproteobacteria bacterium]